jgi:glycosyltransferase involved in cell wall biosynthesis
MNASTGSINLTVVIPLLNEEENVGPLYEELVRTFAGCEFDDYEIIFIDDGSEDRTLERLRSACSHDPRVTIIEFTKRFGQTAALGAGFRFARGRVIVPMDGDMQNDPQDILKLVEKLDESPGWDIVSGWRRNRQDKMVRRLFSRVANRLVRRLTWSAIHDFGCTLKAYRREVLEDVRLYGEMHRFLPAVCKWRGARVTEMVVHHRARKAGTSKYGFKRTIKVLLDLLTVKFFGDYLTKPIYFFGKLTLVTMTGAFLALGVAILQKYGYLYTGPGDGLNLNRNVLVLFSMLLFLSGLNFIMIGVISELLVRIYYESQGLPPYKIRSLTRGRNHEADTDKSAEKNEGSDVKVRSVA